MSAGGWVWWVGVRAELAAPGRHRLLLVSSWTIMHPLHPSSAPKSYAFVPRRFDKNCFGSPAWIIWVNLRALGRQSPVNLERGRVRKARQARRHIRTFTNSPEPRLLGIKGYMQHFHAWSSTISFDWFRWLSEGMVMNIVANKYRVTKHFFGLFWHCW